MTNLARFAADQSEFNRLAQAVGVALDPAARLPAWPFRREMAFVHFIEFERALGGNFAEVLSALAQVYDDRLVTTVVFDPPLRHYSDAYGLLPGFEVETPALEAGYLEGVRYEPGGDPTGALAYTANVIAIVGSSGEWSVWGQRDWEIAVLLTPHDSGPWLNASIPVHARDLDLDSIRSPAGWGMSLSEDERCEFWQNVRSRGSGQ